MRSNTVRDLLDELEPVYPPKKSVTSIENLDDLFIGQ